MRFSPSLLLVAIAASCITPFTTWAQDPPTYIARLNARRDLDSAKMELRHYQLVEYPRQQRHLNSAIALTHAEIRDYKARLRAYDAFDRFSIGQPFLVTLQETRMCLRDAELRLRDLWAERNALVRFRSDQWRLLEMQAFEARLRVAELEAELEAEQADADGVDADEAAAADPLAQR
jgi:hypothetical protein